MFDIKDKIIFITKGDSATINVQLKNQDGTDYVMANGDTITLTVRKKIDATVLLTATSSTNTINLTPTQTKLLEVGMCFYDIQLTTGANEIFTVAGAIDSIIPNMKVYPEVTV